MRKMGDAAAEEGEAGDAGEEVEADDVVVDNMFRQ